VSTFAIVTVTHNSERDLERLLDSIDRELPKGSDPFRRVEGSGLQVIVVDSGSSDRSAELAREWRAEVIALGRNAGFGVGCNVGVARVEASVTALVNPDVELLDGGLAELARRAEAADALRTPASPPPSPEREAAPSVSPSRSCPSSEKRFGAGSPGSSASFTPFGVTACAASPFSSASPGIGSGAGRNFFTASCWPTVQTFVVIQ
jgi:hypothetical protein